MQLREQLPSARQLIETAGMISLPKEVMDLHRLFETQEVPNFADIADIIGQNVMLAGEVVQAANLPSVQGDHFREVLSIQDAIDILGVRRLKNLVKAIALKLTLETLGLKDLVEHSLAVAELSSKISKHLALLPGDEAYLLGLFHNIGAIMLGKFDDNYQDIFQKSLTAPLTSIDIELERYQTSHPVVGLLVAENWELEDIFKKVIVMHHEKNMMVIRNQELRKLVALIQLSTAIIAEKKYQVYMTPELKTVAESCVMVLELDAEAITEIWQMV